MAPDSITVDLDHAKKLLGAEWNQDVGLFKWIKPSSSLKPFVVDRSNALSRDVNTLEMRLAAPTAEEILRRLPRMHIDTDGYEVEYVLPNTKIDHGDHTESATHRECGSSLANSAAAMWVFLKNNNLLPKP